MLAENSVKQPKKALIAMSGGVDSSMAAALLCEQGFSCIGCTMKLYENEDIGESPSKTCCSLDDTEDARRVAASLGMPYYVFRFTDEFREKIMCRFAQAYREGRTPNPCIDCNRYMKFDKLFARAREIGCDYVVTGHYARTAFEDGRWLLKKGLDASKDQSYVLYSLTQEQLAHVLFPLGGYTKQEIRQMAEARGFVNADKPDSQDICFVPDGDYASFIEQFTGVPSVPGHYVTPGGEILGTHKGIIHYTLGQRKGLGLAMGRPVFVCGIRPETNEVVIGDEELLFSREAVISDVNWIVPEPSAPIRAKAKARYRHREQPAEIVPLGGGRALLRFDEPQRAITPGQAAVFYDGYLVLGGGEIESVGGA